MQQKRDKADPQKNRNPDNRHKTKKAKNHKQQSEGEYPNDLISPVRITESS